MFEVFVCSADVEAVHLRGGRVARGIRWSDRREDFREVLGLMKAQGVKNVVLVPAPRFERLGRGSGQDP